MGMASLLTVVSLAAGAAARIVQAVRNPTPPLMAVDWAMAGVEVSTRCDLPMWGSLGDWRWAARTITGCGSLARGAEAAARVAG
jgi:hypothetical protein